MTCMASYQHTGIGLSVFLCEFEVQEIVGLSIRCDLLEKFSRQTQLVTLSEARKGMVVSVSTIVNHLLLDFWQLMALCYENN